MKLGAFIAVNVALAGAAAPLAAQGPVAATLEVLPTRVGAPDETDLRGTLLWAREQLALDSLHPEANWRAATALSQLANVDLLDARRAQRDSAYAEALVYARRAVRVSADDANAQFAYAMALGDYAMSRGPKERVKLATEIRDVTVRGLALDSLHDGLHHILGRWHAEMMRVGGVERYFAKQFLGARVFDEASWAQAEVHLATAVRLDPSRIFHRLDLARVLADRKRRDEARTQLEALAALPARNEVEAQYQAEGRALLAKLDG